MTWNQVRKAYLNNFKDFSIIINIPDVSLIEHGRYTFLAMECAIGKSVSPFVTIDYERKEVIVKI
jgi:hypothetical protein